MADFIQLLKIYGFDSSKKDLEDRRENSYELRRKYVILMEMFFAQENKREEAAYLHAMANRFFEFCFYRNTWPAFQNILSEAKLHPIGRLLYANIWNQLAGKHGQKYWLEECLRNLQQEAARGKQIVYIDGETDIYQLLRYGIYNIAVIDPFLPSQIKVDSQNWEWMSNPQKDEEKYFLTLDNRVCGITLQSFENLGSFSATLTNGRKVTLPKSTAVWTIFDKQTHKTLGSITLYRRLAEPSDFIPKADKALLMSFHDLYYLTTDDPNHSWGIRPELLNQQLNLYVKQLRSPITQEIIHNMSQAENFPLTIISLGSEAHGNY